MCPAAVAQCGRLLRPRPAAPLPPPPPPPPPRAAAAAAAATSSSAIGWHPRRHAVDSSPQVSAARHRPPAAGVLSGKPPPPGLALLAPPPKRLRASCPHLLCAQPPPSSLIFPPAISPRGPGRRLSPARARWQLPLVVMPSSTWETSSGLSCRGGEGAAPTAPHRPPRQRCARSRAPPGPTAR